nr:histone-lysine N-methyltransferase SETD1A-like [Ipomoea batatas]
MRSFPVSTRPPAPAKKISLGSKKVEPSKPADPTGEVPVPTGLPLTATHLADLCGEQDAARATKRGKEKEVLEVEEVAIVKRSRRNGSGSMTPVIDVLMKHGDKSLAALLTRICAAAPPPEKTSGWSTALVGERIARDLIQDGDEIHRRDVAPLKKSLAKRDQRIKELEGKLRTAEETGRRILERADLGEKILTDPDLLARHICRGRETREAVLAAISRTAIGEDLMYEFGSWAFNSGRRAMQNDVRTALEVSIDDDDLPRILAVLPEELYALTIKAGNRAPSSRGEHLDLTIKVRRPGPKTGNRAPYSGGEHLALTIKVRRLVTGHLIPEVSTLLSPLGSEDR